MTPSGLPVGASAFPAAGTAVQGIGGSSAVVPASNISNAGEHTAERMVAVEAQARHVDWDAVVTLDTAAEFVHMGDLPRESYFEYANTQERLNQAGSPDQPLDRLAENEPERIVLERQRLSRVISLSKIGIVTIVANELHRHFLQSVTNFVT